MSSRSAHLRDALWLGLIMVIGTAARVAFFAPDTALWGDEAALALNLSRTAAELARPLDHGQHAPYLYLLLERALFLHAGVNEHWLRLPALIASIVSLPLFAFVADRIAGRGAALVGTTIVAVSPGLVRYGAELKPYESDVVVSLLIVWLAWNVFRFPGRSRWVVGLGVAGSLFPWMSYPSIFVLTAAGGAMLIDAMITRRPGALLVAAATIAAWLASAIVLYLLVARHSMGDRGLESFWEYAFAPLPPKSLWDIRHAVELFGAMFVNPIGLAGAGVGVALFLFGAAALAAKNWRLLVLCTGPIALAFVASGFHAYPFATRLVLFAAPLALLQIAAGVTSLHSAFPSPWTAVTLTAVLAAAPLAATKDLMGESIRSGVRDVLDTMNVRASSGDAIYVYYKAEMSFELYRGRLTVPRVTVARGADDVREGTRVRDDLTSLAGHRRVWFLFSEVHTFFIDEEKLMLSEIERHGRRLDAVQFGPTRSYLYQSPDGQWARP